jgi:hypothetical protein
MPSFEEILSIRALPTDHLRASFIRKFSKVGGGRLSQCSIFRFADLILAAKLVTCSRGSKFIPKMGLGLG